MFERRRYVRADGLVLINCKVPKIHLENKSSAFDISGAGLRITLDKKLEPATLVEMEVYLPGSSQPILAKGEVIWAQKCKEKLATQISPQKEYFYTGIKFTTIEERSRNRIIDYVKRKFYRE